MGAVKSLVLSYYSMFVCGVFTCASSLLILSTTTMRVASFLSSILFAAVVLAADPPTELKIETTYRPEDCSVKAAKGDQIKVHYTGTLHANGNKFDSSLDRGSPLPLTLGVGQVIKGWDEGLVGMCVNEKRTLTIPSDMAYGSRGFGSVIPANSALVFTVELVGLDSKALREAEQRTAARMRFCTTAQRYVSPFSFCWGKTCTTEFCT
ncbi:Peptidylprolyl isomerase [Mycena venus]|uniref:peptidylprolyl isomerase n=1 Tax=Mycena venus TaxID=2733690 RepID=A0A8H6WXI6_9AGAR|nr:Peptidylprolyl isomerase [Mycena venus]